MGNMTLDSNLFAFHSVAVPVVGTISEMSPDGTPIVLVPGRSEGLEARCCVPEAAVPAPDALVGAKVLLLFVAEAHSRPIIVGFVRERLWSDPPESRLVVKAPANSAETVVIEAEKQLVLKCGEGSINMESDGRIVIKGRQLTSRATEANKVRGAVVLIN